VHDTIASEVGYLDRNLNWLAQEVRDLREQQHDMIRTIARLERAIAALAAKE
jgi:hypothetical protein